MNVSIIAVVCQLRYILWHIHSNPASLIQFLSYQICSTCRRTSNRDWVCWWLVRNRKNVKSVIYIKTKDLFYLERWINPRTSGCVGWCQNCPSDSGDGEGYHLVQAPPCLTSQSHPLEYRQHFWTCLLQTFFWCMLHVWTVRCRETPDLILWRSSGVHVWKGMKCNLPYTTGTLVSCLLHFYKLFFLNPAC